MSGWVPMPADGWAETAALLTSTGQPWPEQAVVADLRWHEDQGRAIPGRPTLGRRWNWKDWAVRTMLSDEAAWKDPLRLGSPAPLQRAPASLQRAPAAQRTNATPQRETSSIPPADTSSPPADLHRRGVHPAPSPPPPLEQLLDLQRESGVEPNDADRASLVRELQAGWRPDALAAVLAEASRPERGIRALRWSVVLGPQFAELRRAAAKHHSERRVFQGDYDPDAVTEPDLPVEPDGCDVVESETERPPSDVLVAPREVPETDRQPQPEPPRRGWWPDPEPSPVVERPPSEPPEAAVEPDADPEALPPPEEPPRLAPGRRVPGVERPELRPPPDPEQARRAALALERVRAARAARARAPPPPALSRPPASDEP